MVRTEPVLNFSEDLTELLILDAKCFEGGGDPRVGILVLETKDGVYQLIVTEVHANIIIQQLRDFIAENSDPLPD